MSSTNCYMCVSLRKPLFWSSRIGWTCSWLGSNWWRALEIFKPQKVYAVVWCIHVCSSSQLQGKPRLNLMSEVLMSLHSELLSSDTCRKYALVHPIWCTTLKPILWISHLQGHPEAFTTLVVNNLTYVSAWPSLVTWTKLKLVTGQTCKFVNTQSENRSSMSSMIPFRRVRGPCQRGPQVCDTCDQSAQLDGQSAQLYSNQHLAWGFPEFVTFYLHDLITQQVKRRILCALLRTRF